MEKDFNHALKKALDYVENLNHSDFYAFPLNGKGKENHLIIALYKRETIVQSIINEKILTACNVEIDTLKISRLQRDRIQQSFGKPLIELHLREYENYKSLECDAKDHLKATTFEKVVSRAIKNGLGIATKWVGRLNNSTFDVYLENGQHVEVKGMRGCFASGNR